VLQRVGQGAVHDVSDAIGEARILKPEFNNVRQVPSSLLSFNTIYLHRIEQVNLLERT